MSELAIFIIGVSVFTVTVMAVLWTGYLVAADRFDEDQVEAENASPVTARER